MRVARWVPWAIWFGALGAGLVAIWLGNYPLAELAFFMTMATLTGTVGAVVASRLPSNPIGWILLGVNALASGSYLADAILLVTGNRQLAEWLDHVTWWPPIGLFLLVVPLIFPDGRPLSPRWRLLLIVAVAGIVGFTLFLAFGPDLGAAPQFGPNPYHLALLAPMALALSLLMPLALVGAVASIVVRFRRSRGIERQQMKWIVYSFFIFLAVALLTSLPIDENITFSALWIAAFFIPIAIGVAILRYRLYDIDRLISRTVTYTLVVGLLAGVFAGGNLLLQRLLPFQSSLAVAGSTLAVAGLFNPLRRRVQAVVDRRFNRARYDAEQTLDTFAGRLRAGVDFDTLRDELGSVVAFTMQPVRVSLWLRQPGATE